MTIEENLKKLMITNSGSMREFSKKIGMSQSTLATIMRRGVHNASVTNVIKICKELGISADALASDEIVFVGSQKKKKPTKELRDIYITYRLSLNQLDKYSLDGVEMTREEILILLDGIDLMFEFIKRQRKRSKG